MRIGILCYLHSLPFRQPLPKGEVVLGKPRELLSKMINKELDYAFLPVVVEKNYRFFPIGNVGIACKGKVKSVALFCKHYPPSRIFITPESLTSRALLYWLAKEDGMDFSLEKNPEKADALLLMGDEALEAYEKKWMKIVDLGQWWWEKTGKPFVFARLYGQTPKDQGVSAKLLENLHKFFASPPPLPSETLAYLHSLNYRITSEEEEGLTLFLSKVEP